MDIVELLKWYVVFVFSTTVHEAAHAWTAWKLGDDTAHRGGQVSLNPVWHIRREPIGMVAIPIVSFLMGGWMIGWASAPYNAQWALTYPRRAGLMAVAGPLSNLTLAILAGLAIHAGVGAHIFQAPAAIGFTHMTEALGAGWPVIAAQMLSIALSLNLLLAAFNLLPIPPLDGSSMLLLLCSQSSAVTLFRFLRQPTLRMVGLLVAWNYFGPVYRPIQHFAIHLLYPDTVYMFHS